MKQLQSQRCVPVAVIALFVVVIALGLLTSKDQTRSLTEQELIKALHDMDVLNVLSDHAHYFRFLDPILANMAIDTAVAGSRYQGAWEINHQSILPDKINIITIDSGEWNVNTDNPICIFRRNAVYLPNLETIVVDVQAARVVAERTKEPGDYIDVVMAWIIGHEIGHAVLEHRRSTFFGFDELSCEGSALKRLTRLFSLCVWHCKSHQALELEADHYFVSQIMEVSNGSELMLQFLIPLLGDLYENPDPKSAGVSTHPSHTRRMIELIRILSCDGSVDETLRGKLMQLLSALSGSVGSQTCSTQNSADRLKD